MSGAPESDSLPLEMWRECMLCLDDDRDFQSFACVCKDFCGLKRNFWVNRMEQFEKRFVPLALVFPEGVPQVPAPKLVTLVVSAMWVLHVIVIVCDKTCDLTADAARFATLTRMIYDWRCSAPERKLSLSCFMLQSRAHARPPHVADLLARCYCSFEFIPGNDSSMKEHYALLLTYWTILKTEPAAIGLDIQIMLQLGDLFMEPVMQEYLAELHRRCKLCGTSEQVVVSQRQIRAADEAPQLRAHCHACNHIWVLD